MRPNDLPQQYNEFSSWRGTYDPLKTYDKGEAVAYQGSAYVCLQYDVLGVTPGTDANKWALLAAAGEGVPVGGLTNQVLSKASGADYDTTWADPGQASHPNLATHDTMGLATDTELSTHAAVSGAHHAKAHDHTVSDGSGVLTNDEHDGFSEYAEITEPAAPAANKLRLYIVDQNGYEVLEGKGSSGETRRYARDNIIVAKATGVSGVTKGQAVYVSGALGANEEVQQAKADAAATMPAIGFALDTVAQNGYSRIIFSGKIANIDTLAFSEGAVLYVSPTTAGAVTSTKPSFPNIPQRIGVVTRSSATVGEILVQVGAATEMPATGYPADVAVAESDGTGSVFALANHVHAHGSGYAGAHSDHEAAGAVAAHAGAGDPHTGYQKESEKGQANGYASLDATSTVPDAQIPGGIARDSEVSSAITTHEGAGDPHTGYVLESAHGGVTPSGHHAQLHASTHSTGQGDEVTPAAIGAATSGHGHGQLHDELHAKEDHNGAALPGTANESLGGYYLDVAQIAAPANPAAGTRRVFVDSADGKLKVRTSGGSSVSLEEQGGGVTFGSPTGNIDIGDAADEGTSPNATRADHQHAFTAPTSGYPVDVASTEADGTATTPARADHRHAHGSGYAGGHTDVASHGTSGHSGGTLSGAANEDLNGYYLDVDQIAAPANPAAGTRRLFVDSADGKLKVRTSAGASVSLEEQGGGVTFGAPTGDIDIGDSAQEGSSGNATRADHQHAFTAPTAGYPVDVGQSEADGSSTTPARADHQHAHGSGYLPDAHHARSHDHSNASDGTTLSPATLNLPSATAPAQTAEGQVVWDSNDDTLTVGDGVASRKEFGYLGATNPSTQAFGDAAVPGTSKEVTRVDHKHAMPANPVSYGSPTGAIDIGDTESGGSQTTLARSDHQHAFAAPSTGYPVDVASTEADGTATTAARADHRHAHGTGYSGGHTDVAAHALTSHTHSGGAAGKFMRETGATTYVFEAVVISKGGTVLSPTAAINVIVWYAPFACTVTNVRGYRVGGTGATINARRNGTLNHLSANLSVTSADTWMDGGAVQNTAYAAGDKLEIMVVSVSGSPTQVAVQVDFTRP